MEKIIRVLVLLIALLAFAPLCAASDDDWGFKAEQFVDNELPMLSRRIAEAELADRWEKGIRLFNSGLLLRIVVIGSKLNRMKVPAPVSGNAPLNVQLRYVSDLQGALKSLTRIDIEMDDVDYVLKRSEEVCVSSAVHSALNFDSIMRTGVFAVTLPTPNYSFEVSTDLVGSFVRMFSGNLVANKVEQQNNKFRSAMERAPSRLIAESDIFALSNSICEERQKSYIALGDEIGNVISKQRSVSHRIRFLLYNRLVPAEREVLRLISQQLINSSGLNVSLNLYSESGFWSLVNVQAVIIRLVIEGRLAKLETEPCLSWLVEYESLVDYISEAILQADALSSFGNGEVKQISNSLKTNLQSRLLELQLIPIESIRARCR